MIKTFTDKDTEKLFKRKFSKKLPTKIQPPARRKLVMIDAATAIEDLPSPSGNRLEKLSGNRKGQYSIRINDQWRICFVWKSGHAYQVEVTDYH